MYKFLTMTVSTGQALIRCDTNFRRFSPLGSYLNVIIWLILTVFPSTARCGDTKTEILCTQAKEAFKHSQYKNTISLNEVCLAHRDRTQPPDSVVDKSNWNQSYLYALETMGAAYLEIGAHDKALKTLDKADDKITEWINFLKNDKEKDHSGLIVLSIFDIMIVTFLKADVFLGKGDLVKAETFVDKGLGYNDLNKQSFRSDIPKESLDLLVSWSPAYFLGLPILAQIRLLQNKPAEAEAYLDEAVRMLEINAKSDEQEKLEPSVWNKRGRSRCEKIRSQLKAAKRQDKK